MARYTHEYSDTLVDNAVADGRISMDDAGLLKQYLNGPAPGISNSATRYNTFFILATFRQYIGEYRRNTLDELFDGLKKFKESGRKPETELLYLGKLRQFYLWLSEQGYSSIPREFIDHKIRIRRSERVTGSSDLVLTIDDISPAYQDLQTPQGPGIHRIGLRRRYQNKGCMCPEMERPDNR